MKRLGITSIILGLIGITGAVDTGNGWVTSISLIFGGVCFLVIYFLERRMEREKENDRITAQFLITFYKSDGNSGRGYL